MSQGSGEGEWAWRRGASEGVLLLSSGGGGGGGGGLSAAAVEAEARFEAVLSSLHLPAAAAAEMRGFDDAKRQQLVAMVAMQEANASVGRAGGGGGGGGSRDGGGGAVAGAGGGDSGRGGAGERVPLPRQARQLPPRQLHADDGFAERISLVSERQSGGGGDRDRSSGEEAEHMIIMLREEAMRLRRRGQPGAAMVKLQQAKQLQAQRDAAARKHTRVRRPDIVYSASI